MNIRYPLYEGVYRILTIVLLQQLLDVRLPVQDLPAKLDIGNPPLVPVILQAPAADPQRSGKLSVSQIYFNYLITSLLSLICGPVVGVAAGFVRDTIGFFLDPSYGYFFGYTVTAMASGLVYGLFFYRARLSVARIALCKAVINVFVNILMGSLWSAMLFQKGYLYYLSKSVVKNLLLLPAEILLLVLLYQVLLPVLTRMKLIPAQPSRRIPIF